jgi:2-polyprenyl-3-methyl-5-hydroxy-6-metoxy-1,4-benzoquinol methylase
MGTSQLLCTFCDKNNLESTVQQIKNTYELVFNSIYVLENVDDEHQFILTYNVDSGVSPKGEIPASTISVHRKKHTNTIYTINAINKLIIGKLGYLDTSYKIDWEELKNTILVTAYGSVKLVKTKLHQILKIS